jgi:L-ascorbate metabolism protein UlaG (beta-lactamase superfamily)
MKVSNKMFITDPVVWDINYFTKRKTLLPIEPENLPFIDYVLVSHGHYDHLNTRNIRFLKEKCDLFFVSGPGY